MGSVRSCMLVRMGEGETLGEVDDVFQSLVNRMELPLLLRCVVVDRERQRLPIIPTFTYMGFGSLAQHEGEFSPVFPDNTNPIISLRQPHNRRVEGTAISLSVFHVSVLMSQSPIDHRDKLTSRVLPQPSALDSPMSKTVRCWRERWTKK